jgi:flavin-dependent dehydrogenase
VRRLDLDAALVRRAVAAGARFEPECPVEELVREGVRVVGVRCRRIRTAPRELKATIVLAADGANSRAARRTGLRSEEPDRRFALVGHFRGVSCGLEEVEMHGLGWGYCGFALNAVGEATAAMVVRATELARMQGRAREFFQERLSLFSHIHAALGSAELIHGPLVTGPVGTRSRRRALPGLLIIGDAAGFFDPFTGRGITRALRSGRAAALAAEALLAGDAERHVLHWFEREWCRIDAPRAVERIIRSVVDSPPLLRYAVQRFQQEPELGRILLGVAGDLLPPASVLNAGYLRRLLLGCPSRERDPCRVSGQTTSPLPHDQESEPAL